MRFASKLLLGSVATALALGSANVKSAAGSVVVVANPDTPPLNQATLQRIYRGMVVEVDGRPVVPVNLAKGNVIRIQFMKEVLRQDDDKFIDYWTVRRYVGKGTPPREFDTVEQALEFLRSTPDAIGYVDETADVKGGLRTVLTKP